MDNLQSLVLESFVFDGEQTHEDSTTFIKLCSKITYSHPHSHCSYAIELPQLQDYSEENYNLRDIRQQFIEGMDWHEL